VLELQPGNTEALAIKKQVEDVLAQLDAAASEARAAVQKGELEKASRALAQVLAIDPQHPVAAELSKRLDNSFRGQVDEARQAMKRSQAAADGAHASTQHSFSHALEAAQDAEALLAKGEFTMATQKFLNARDDFERARRAAMEKKAPPSSAPLASASGRPLPVPTPHGGGATPLPGASPAPVPASAAPVASGVDEKPAVLAVIADYARAIEQKDLGLYRRVWPTLSSGEEKKLKAAFGAVQDHKVVIRIESVQVDASGTHATVRMGRNDTVKGKPIGTRSQTVSLVKQGGTWTISAIGQ
jgi:tetratricopeptide (TPR) repeat protein